MKKIAILIVLLLTITAGAQAQRGGRGNGNWGNNGNGNGNWGNNGNNGNGNQGGGNNWGQNGNGNAHGQSNGGGNNNNSSNGIGSGASQTTSFGLSNAIEISFISGSAVGADVNIPFSTVNDYANGVESAEQELKVRSNKNFSIAVKTNASNFTYSGNTTPAPAMPINGVLAVKVTDNATGGSIANPFSANSYSTLSNSNQGLISGASRGGNQRFSIKYKATPGFAYPAGTYSVDVVYTATQQ